MIKSLFSHVREYKRATILTPLLVVAEVSLDIAIPLILARIIDIGIMQLDLDYIIKTGIVVLIIASLCLLSGTLAGNYAAQASAGFAKNLRQDLYDHVQTFSFANIDKFSTASLVTRLTTDINNLQNAFQMIIRITVRAPIILLFSSIAAFSINLKLSSVLIIMMPILALGLFIVMSIAHKYFTILLGHYDNMNKNVEENVEAIRVVKSFVRETHEIHKFNSISTAISHYYQLASNMLVLHIPLLRFSINTATLLVLWWGAKLIVSGEITVGQLSVLTVYIRQVLASIMMLSMVFVNLIISRSSAERIEEVFSEQSSLHNIAQPIGQVTNGSIEFKQVAFSYINDPQKVCLQNINLSIRDGEMVGIIGSTGSAKSSLVQLIPRLYDVTTGSIQIAGIDVKNYDLTALRNAVAMVLQKNLLFSGTISENLRWGNPNASMAELQEACRIAQADEFIRSFPQGYETMLEQGGNNLSGGQKQRICIARALLKQPKILILDDSTSAVDSKTDRLIRQALREKIPHTTKIIIAQRINSLEDADKIIVLDRGQINCIGTSAELLRSNHIYQEIYNLQTRKEA